jgi:c-di-GMP-binding flagellar brake protein YcgR
LIAKIIHVVNFEDVTLDGKDKRIYKRLKMQINVRYRPVSGASVANDEYLTVARNLSAGGLAFSTDEKLKMGMTLQLAVELPGFEAPINCLSRVMRIEEPVSGGSYLVGVCFLDMTGQDRAQLDKFVKGESL